MASVSSRTRRQLEHERKQMPTKATANKASLTKDAKFGIAMNGLGSVEVISIDVINVDQAYQRSLRHDLVNRIGRGYDIVKAGDILVSERPDGSLWCVDGQHRMAGALQAGETEVLAHIIHDLSPEKEAELRLARNDRKPDTIQEKFRTRLVMGDKKAQAIVEVLHQHGAVLNLVSTNTHTGVNAISTCETLYDVDGDGVWLARTLRFLNEAFPPEAEGRTALTPRVASAAMMKSIAWFLDRHVDPREADWQETVEKVSAAGVEDIRRKAINQKAAMGGSDWLNHYRAIVELYNFRRPEKSRLLWKTQGSISTLGANQTPVAHQGKSWA